MTVRAKTHNPFPKVVRRHIEAERQRREDERHASRFNAHQRGYNREWRKASRAFLQAHPVCSGFDSLCEERGLIRPSTDVDHIVPHRGNKRIFWDQTNWQALCHTCHARKTAMEDGGFGRPVAPKAGRRQLRRAFARRPPVVIDQKPTPLTRRGSTGEPVLRGYLEEQR